MEWDKIKINDVIGLGNPLMDFLIEVDDTKLIEMDLAKGHMHLIEQEKAKEILNKIEHHELKIETVPGGSCANTLKGVAALGGSAILCGKVGNDSHGEVYVQEIEAYGVHSRLQKHNSITGHCVTFITPDSQRTFSVHLGAALHFEKLDIFEFDIKKSKILHLEGYQLEGPSKETILYAISVAKKNGTLVSLDLADPALIQRNKDFFQDLIFKGKIDIVFVNETEAKEFTGFEEEKALREIAKYAKIAVVKLGKAGSIIQHKDHVTRIEAFAANAIDTTGAGDSFAAGFLYGLCNDWNIEKSGKLGSLLAAKVVEKIGVKISEINIDELKGKIEDE
jgi:sugar/nucleoside kinase (ribokinase family)